MLKQTLPIDSFLPEIIRGVRNHSSVIVLAEPGAGKTTRVPPALRVEFGGVWIVLQPRRWAARLTATRIAEENGWRLGGEVGYQVRFENRSSKETGVLLMTEGVLLRKLVEDPELQGVRGVILDEFHERSLDLDLSLSLLKEIQGSLRPDLKLVIMSATLDPAALIRYLPDSLRFDIPGRMFPVEKRYLASTNPVQAVQAVLPPDGDVLVFLPGAFEIDRAVRSLEEWLSREGIRGIDVFPLYAALPEEKQKAVFQDRGRRKIICSTNIAETSITLPGIKAVIDSGLQKVMRMDPALGFDRLETLRISRASAEQRAGRAGRVSAGVALRMWSAGEHEQLRHFETPEIHRVNLSRAILMLAEFGVKDFENFDWFEKPRSSMLEFALRENQALGFLTDQGLTQKGRKALRLPLDPSVAAVVLAAREAGMSHFGARFAAFLDGISKEERIRDEEQLVGRLNRLTFNEEKTARQIHGGEEIPAVRLDEFEASEAVLVEACPGRVMVGGRIVGRRKVRTKDGVLPDCGLILSALDQGDLIASSWIPLSRRALEKKSERKRQVEFDEESLRVRAVQGVFFQDLALAPPSEVQALPEEAELALGVWLKKDPEAYFGKDPSLKRFFARIRFAGGGISIPWDQVIPILIQGKTRLSAIDPREVLDAISSVIPRESLLRMEAEAPEKIEVPTGNRIPVDYDSDPPRISVRLQEVFGWLETPRIGGGKVALLMELLSPSFRPIQVTRDLRSFWAGAYFEVKKELKSRYPKHSWPEDPLTAKPEAKGRRRN